jgi:hypothetical protein
MSTLTPLPVVRTGLADAPQAVGASGDTLTNTGKEWIEVINGNASICNVTISATIDGSLVVLQTVAVPATTGRKKIGPFPPHLYGTAVAIGYSVTATVTVGAYSLSAY